MNLLGAKLYDPGTAATKATSSLLAMTAFDTTNLRLAVTVPAHGMVRFRMRCAITGATTSPTILLGVLNGATVVGRVAPTYENATANASSQNFVCDAEFTATGLTPGATNFDAAYAVQVVVASTNIKYGGPNTNGGANAWGAFVFEAWDPQPQQTNGQLVVDANGRVDVSKIAGATQTAGDIPAKTNSLAFTVANQVDSNVLDWKSATAPAMTGDAFARLGTPAGASVSADVAAVKTDTAAIKLKTDNLPAAPASTTNITSAAGIAVSSIGANVITASSINAAALNGKGDWNVGKTGYALSTAGIQAIWDALTSALTTVGSIGKLLVDNINTTISSRLASASYTAPLDAAGTRTAVGLASANLDTQLGTIDDFLDTEIAAIKAKTDNLPSDPADASDIASSFGAVNATLSTIAGYIDTEVAAIKAKTDNLPTLPAAASDCITAVGVRSAVGLASANLDTQLDALPTNAELTTALAGADDAVLSAIGALNNVSATQVEAAATAALVAYDPPTRAEATSDRDAIITEVNANETKIDAVKSKTDSLTFTVAGKVDSNITHVNETEVGGTGETGSEWGPV